MNTVLERLKDRENVVSLLDVTIRALDLAKEVACITPAKVAFGTVSILLTTLRDSMANKTDYVELGLACADVCNALHRVMKGKKPDSLSQSVHDAVGQLVTTVAGILAKVKEKINRGHVSRLFHSRDDKDTIASWKLDLLRILQVFNAELALTTQIIVSGVHEGVVDIRDMVSQLWYEAEANRSALSIIHRVVAGSQEGSVQASIRSGEPPPAQPRACFGRDGLIEEIIDLAEDFTPIALIGPGGIGKTSIALTALHHDRIKQQFGDNRRVIRCDQFPASRANLLNRLSEVTGAGVNNPDDLAPLRPYLSSKDMILLLDNADSILDPRGTDAQEIYAVVKELSEFGNICLWLTSRISTIPPTFETPNIPTLSMAAARDIFYRIYKDCGLSDLVNDVLKQLDFHPLSITLLATVAQHNKWDIDRLRSEWESRRTDLLHTQHDKGLAATIELSLTSPTFRELGPDAQEILGVVAFFPQGVNENDMDFLFPTSSERRSIFDTFCSLSLTSRSDGFVTMLAPLRDYLRPKDPASSSLISITKIYYFDRLSAGVDPDKPSFEEGRWIVSEDTNVEYLLNVFTSVEANSVDVWDACAHFMEHLCWHKKRLVVLGPKIEGLSDSHCSKPQCLFQLSQLFDSVGNRVESKRLLAHALELWRERGDDFQTAETLGFIADTNRWLGLYTEGIQQTAEALEIYERFEHTPGQAYSWLRLARLLYGDKQLDAAENAALRVIDLLSDESKQFTVCSSYRLLGDICRSDGRIEKAVEHYEAAFDIALCSGWRDQLFRIDHSLAELFFGEDRFGEAHDHVERAKLHAINDPYQLGQAMLLQAEFWYKERKFGEAESEVLGAAGAYEQIEAVKDLEACRILLRNIKDAINVSTAPLKWDLNG